MRRKKIKIAKLGLLFFTLLIALASIGVSYSAWTDTITIQGTVNTLEDYSLLCLEGYWKFDESSGQVASDSSWNDNDGQLGSTSGSDDNDPTWTTDTPSGSGYALDFDGINDYVQVPDDDTLEPSEVTVMAWVKSGSVSSYDYILSKGAKGNTAASYALYTGGSAGLYFYIFDGSTYVLSPNAGSGVWNDGWHHIAGTFDGSVVRLYVDGSEIGTGTSTSISIGYGLPTTDDLFIGSYNTGYNFNGIIDEVKIYSCTLDASEIWDEYQAGL